MMNVGDLRKMLEGVDDNMQVLIPTSMEFTGAFYSPCGADSGVTTLGMGDFDEEDLKEMELLNKKPEERDAFLLIPCGFTEEHEHDNKHELN